MATLSTFRWNQYLFSNGTTTNSTFTQQGELWVPAGTLRPATNPAPAEPTTVYMSNYYTQMVNAMLDAEMTRASAGSYFSGPCSHGKPPDHLCDPCDEAAETERILAEARR